ncbi:transcriptional regulator FeaR [Pseudomonas sp. ABC1]|uniref:transcriptional regulator FeaR n=1 Tax=Pseudomonas sp. ABC1 TaxID=2748080 RepID=UPI0015C2D606|nr:transcriptional regulator FeaR [Pseudomonas sp. ABC1]QLF93404.1 transcriptional regulator FeaR [Pseudomonas sp. ABC1]
MNVQQLARNNLESWTSAMQAICGRFHTQMAFNRSLFIGEVDTRRHAGIMMAHLRTNAGLISRAGRQADLEDDQSCFLVSQRSGFSQISQNGETIQLAPGDLLLMDSVGSCDIMPFGLIEHASLSLPRQAVARVMKNRDSHFGKISTHKTSGRALHLLMDQLCRAEDGRDEAGEADALQAALISLLGCALDNGQDEGSASAALHSGNLRGYVQKIIDESLTQPGLTPVSLAERLNISVRHLYRLFEEQEDSVCRYIQRTRLKRSAEDLANPCLRSESITSIAYKWGFTDSAHFSRAFKKQFELPPKDYRANALEGMRARVG